MVQLAKKIDTHTDEEITEHGMYFRTVYVFDIDQTDGEPLPEEPVWINQGDGGEIIVGIIALIGVILEIFSNIGS